MVSEFTCDGDLRIKLIGDQIHDFFGDRNDGEEEGGKLSIKQKAKLVDKFNKIHETNLLRNIGKAKAQEMAEVYCGDIKKFIPLQSLNQQQNQYSGIADYPQIASVVDYMYSSSFTYLKQSPDVNYNVVIDAIKQNKTLDYAMNDFRLKNKEVTSIYTTQEGNDVATKALQKISFRPTLANLYDMATEDSLIKNSIVKYGEIAKIKDEVSYKVSDNSGYSIQWSLKKFPNFIEIADHMMHILNESEGPEIAKIIKSYLIKENKVSGNVTKTNLAKVLGIGFFGKYVKKVDEFIKFFIKNGKIEIYGLLYKSMLDGIKKLNNTKFYEQGNKTQIKFETVFKQYFNKDYKKISRTNLENAVVNVPLQTGDDPVIYLIYHLKLVHQYSAILGKKVYSYPNGNPQLIDKNFIDYYSVKDVFICEFIIGDKNFSQVMLDIQFEILKEGGPSVRTITRLIMNNLKNDDKFICLLFSKTLCDLGVICSTFEDGVISNNTVNYFTTFDITCALIASSLRMKNGQNLAPFVLFNKVGEKSIPGMTVYLPDRLLDRYFPITDKVMEAAESMIQLRTQGLHREQCELFKSKFLEGYDPENPIIKELYTYGCNNYQATMILLERLEISEFQKIQDENKKLNNENILEFDE